MSDLRRRTQEINAEYWAGRDSQTERVAVAQLTLALARAELAAPPADQARLRAALGEAYHRSGQFGRVAQARKHPRTSWTPTDKFWVGVADLLSATPPASLADPVSAVAEERRWWADRFAAAYQADEAGRTAYREMNARTDDALLDPAPVAVEGGTAE